MFDLNRLKLRDTAEYKLRDEKGRIALDGNGQPAVFYLVGTDSPQFHEQQRANRRKERERREEKREATQAELDAEFVDLLVACTTGWDNVGIGDEPMEFTPENARRLYAGWPIVRDQIDAFVVRRGNFIEG